MAEKKTVVPDGAKKPEDHKPKATADGDVKVAMIHGKEWTIPGDALDDFELLDDINELEANQNAARLPSILRRLIGDQWREAMDLLRNKDTGRVSLEDGGKFVEDVLKEIAPNS